MIVIIIYKDIKWTRVVFHCVKLRRIKHLGITSIVLMRLTRSTKVHKASGHFHSTSSQTLLCLGQMAMTVLNWSANSSGYYLIYTGEGNYSTAVFYKACVQSPFLLPTIKLMNGS